MKKIGATILLTILNLPYIMAQNSGNTTIDNLYGGIAKGARTIASLVALIAIIFIGFKFFNLGDDERSGDEGKKLGKRLVFIIIGCAILFGAPSLIQFITSLAQNQA